MKNKKAKRTHKLFMQWVGKPARFRDDWSDDTLGISFPKEKLMLVADAVKVGKLKYLLCYDPEDEKSKLLWLSDKTLYKKAEDVNSYENAKPI